MSPPGVRTLLAAALALSLVTALAAQAATTPPPCWKGRAGCTHTSTPSWGVSAFSGTVSVVGTRRNSLTCAAVANGAKEEIVAGRYTVDFKLRPAKSGKRIGSDAQKLPRTTTSLRLPLDVTSKTHERLRTLTPTGDGQCAETFRDCDKSETSTAADRLTVFVRARRVIQETAGAFVQSRLLECAATPDMTSLLPADALESTLVSEDSAPSHFHHRGTAIPIGSDRQVGDGDTTIAISGRLTYARFIHACTRYPRTRARCSDARG